MITGRQALRSIEQAAGDVRGQEADLAAALRSADETLARLRTERTNLFRQLAQARLDALQRESITSDLDAAERRALELIKQGQSSLDDLARRQKEAEQRLRTAQDRQHEKAEALGKAMEALEEFQARIETTARATPAWTAQKANVDRAQEIFVAADQKATQSAADLDSKRKPYENDPLFMYLWNRKFGQAEYRVNHLVRFLDRKVAALVGYSDARPNYYMLNEIPLRLREHADRCKADVEAQKAKLVEIEQKALVTAGSAPLERTYKEAQAALATADAELAKAESEIKAIDAERSNAIQADRGSLYQQAIDIVSEADSRESIRELYREARRTRSKEDDAVLKQIERNDDEIEEAQEESQRLRREVQEVSRRRSDIDTQIDDFRRSGYDHPMGRFGNESVIGDVIGGIVKGVVQGAVLGTVLKGGFSQRSPRADSNFGGPGGFTLPFPGGRNTDYPDPFPQKDDDWDEDFRTGGSF